jgi:hypothetical protein
MDKQTPDHDILITLVETVKNNHTALLDKISGVKSDVGEIKDNVNIQIANHELRLKSIEELHTRVNPEVELKKLNEVYQWSHDFRITWKFILGVAITVSSIISFVLGTILDVFKLFGK